MAPPNVDAALETSSSFVRPKDFSAHNSTIMSPRTTLSAESPVFLEARLPTPTSSSDRDKPAIGIDTKADLEVRIGQEDTVSVECKVEGPEESQWLGDVLYALHSRPREEALLRESLLTAQRRTDNSARNFTLISGPPGSGLSAFARSAIQPVVDKMGGYLISGKFEKHTQSTPYFAFVMAINEFANLVIERGEKDMKLFARGIQLYVGDNNVDLLLRWIPSLSKIVGRPCGQNEEQVATPKKVRTGSMESFVLALKTVRKAMELVERPIFFLAEDIQFADPSSLEILFPRRAGAQQCRGHLVATCDNSITPDCELASRLRDAEDTAKVKIINIGLNVLGKEKIESALVARLGLHSSDCRQLCQILIERTKGDYYLVGVLLKWISDNGILYRDAQSGTFAVDYDDLQLSLGARTGHDILTGELVALEPETLEVLKVSACLGYLFNADVVGLVLDRDIYGILSLLCDKGLLLWCPISASYCFGHDLVQEAAHDLIPEKDRALFHLEIGRRVWRKVDADQLDQFMYIILHQIQRGKHLVRREKERSAVAKLCLYAGEAAAASSSFEKALSVFELGVSLLEEESWIKEYDLTLSLYSAAVEMYMYTANFEEMDRLIDYTIEHARTTNDTLRVYTCRVNTLGVRGRYRECVEVGHRVLCMLGHAMPQRLCVIHGFEDLKTVKKILRGKSDDQLLRLPKMQDKNVLEALRIMSLMIFPSMNAKSATGPMVLLRMMKLTLTYGHSVFSPMSFIAYAIFCTAGHGKFDQAYRFGKLALRLQELHGRVEYLPRVYASYYGFIHGWRKPLKQALTPLLEAHSVGIQSGDLDFAGISYLMYCGSSIETGNPLDEVYASMLSVRETMVSKRQESLLLISAPVFAYVGRLIGRAPVEDFDLDVLEQHAELLSSQKVECIKGLWNMRMHHTFDEVEEAGRLLEEMDFDVMMTAPQFAVIGLYSLRAMVAVANVRLCRNIKYHKKVVQRAKKRFRQWARSCPHECSSKLALIEAEWASVHGQNEIAREKYTNAVLMAQGMGNWREVAMSLERSMHHYLGINDIDTALFHGHQAYEAYVSWGALAKANHLKSRLDTLLASMNLDSGLPVSCQQ